MMKVDFRLLEKIVDYIKGSKNVYTIKGASRYEIRLCLLLLLESGFICGDLEVPKGRHSRDGYKFRYRACFTGIEFSQLMKHNGFYDHVEKELQGAIRDDVIDIKYFRWKYDNYLARK